MLLAPFPTPELCCERLHTSTRSQPEAGLPYEFCRGTGAGERLCGAKMRLQVVARAPTVLNFTQTKKKIFFQHKKCYAHSSRSLVIPHTYEAEIPFLAFPFLLSSFPFGPMKSRRSAAVSVNVSRIEGSCIFRSRKYFLFLVHK